MFYQISFEMQYEIASLYQGQRNAIRYSACYMKYVFYDKNAVFKVIDGITHRLIKL